MYPGFGKASGPTGPPGSQPLFGNFGGGRPPSPSPPSPPTTPPFSGAAPLRSPSRGTEAPGQLYSLPLGFERVHPAASQPFPSAGVYRRPESSGQLHSPPLAFERARPAASHPHPSAGVHRSTESHPTSDHGQRSSFKNYDTQAHQRPSAVTSFVVSRNSGTSVTAKVSRFQDTEGIRSPPFLSKDVNFRNSTQGAPRSHLVAPRIRSPPLVSYEDLHPSVGVEEPSVSSVGFNTRSNTNFSTPDSRVHQKSLQSASNTISEAAAGNATNIPVAKRTRSPPLLPEDQVFHGNSHATQDGTEREMQAKAKRLARFKVELSKTPQNNPDNVEPGVSANRHEQSNVERNKLAAYKSTELAMGGSDGNALPEDEGVVSSGIIIGLCPDMCPESERAERERKGDLDQYERLDGDRNQTSMSLAVKKYNRTAERDANLIRPMPILQKTIDYLLNLLDQPYNDRFLRIYNFLWDRMRAIRMDLRMQHIFNQEAITMLEQMIRLHIIVMHELCEYSRGEGFAEGFDAHLNIEQMNKTSVELFQLYDDHRKKGINIPTEKEFRGYYALLKLDKHPGYMVEPAELSLDLAKMTPEIRQTSEVLFARDVARACRTGNFIAFFRLGRKASYLQSCLMHAHFSKLRTQALASIHAGLQNNQGLPIADGAKWLAMEEDEIESLSEYHGFVIKSFQEPYIVKEGPFLNGDEDYPTKCSKLVDMKKSRRIVEDVLASSQVIPSSSKATKKTQLTKSNKPEPKTISYVEKKSPVHRAPAIEVTKPLHEVDEEMPNFEAFSPPKDARQRQQMFQAPIFSSPEDSRQKQQTIQTPIFGQYSEDSPKVAAVSPSPWGFSSFTRQPDKVGTIEKQNYDVLFSNSPERSMHSGMERMPLQIESKTSLQERSVGIYNSGKEYPDIQIMVTDNLEGEEPPDLYQIDENNDVMESSQQEEIAEAKLKLILRLWKRRALKLRQLREKKQLAANAALNSLSLGPPIQLKTDQPSTSGEFDIDLVLRKRFKNHGRSWSRLNVSDVIADILGTRNPDARCLCWKTVVCSQMNNLEGDDLGQRSHFLGAAPWLLSKLMPSENDADNDDEDLVVSSPGVSIWKKWVCGQAGSDLNCYLSVVKDASFDNLSQSVSGASAVLFLTSESISWNLQKVRLHNLLMLIPYGSCLPLLILSGSYKNNVDDSTIVDNLGLRDLDKSRISSFLVVPLVESQQMGQMGGFFSDNQLREGLRWLASESPLQPILHHVKTLELVLTHLNSSLEPLDRMKDYEAGPDNCILAFNEALDWSQKEIAAAAKSNPSSWPCPEIALLEEFSDEYRVVKWCLPSVGWSSAEKVEPLMSALGDCRLPAFPDHISWLPQCCNAGKEIENLRGELENGLIEYLTNSSKMMGLALAIKEAHVMLQRSCRLQRHDSCCYIVPNWVMIFRRIFNWRLMGLANGASSSAYVLESPHLNAVFENLGKLGLEDAGPSPCYLNQPSLDEIIEVGRTPLSSHRGQPLVESGVAVPETSPNGEIHETPNTTDWMEDERSLAHDGQAEIENVSHENGRLENAGGEMVVTGEVGKGAEKLSILLEQCNMLQNVIDEKLSIFF